MILLPSSKPSPGPRSEGQVLGVKQREGPVLAEERFNAAHLAGDQFLLRWGTWEKMSEASDGFLRKELTEHMRPRLSSPLNLPVLYLLCKCEEIKSSYEELGLWENGEWAGCPDQ